MNIILRGGGEWNINVLTAALRVRRGCCFRANIKEKDFMSV
jgi:hypothetical protein